MTRTTNTVALVLVVLTALFAGCGYDEDSSDTCRFEPAFCEDGRAGAFCNNDRDCRGTCCTTGNCGGGMCTYSCFDDRDCPSDMGCEHNVCFYYCRYDDDCAVGQRCEHDNTVCEWR